jgi:hypothetical protein
MPPSNNDKTTAAESSTNVHEDSPFHMIETSHPENSGISPAMQQNPAQNPVQNLAAKEAREHQDRKEEGKAARADLLPFIKFIVEQLDAESNGGDEGIYNTIGELGKFPARIESVLEGLERCKARSQNEVVARLQRKTEDIDNAFARIHGALFDMYVVVNDSKQKGMGYKARERLPGLLQNYENAMERLDKIANEDMFLVDPFEGAR